MDRIYTRHWELESGANTIFVSRRLAAFILKKSIHGLWSRFYVPSCIRMEQTNFYRMVGVCAETKTFMIVIYKQKIVDETEEYTVIGHDSLDLFLMAWRDTILL